MICFIGKRQGAHHRGRWGGRVTEVLSKGKEKSLQKSLQEGRLTLKLPRYVLKSLLFRTD